MSIKIMSYVSAFSKAKSSTELRVLEAIADFAHDDGGGAYPSIADLASKTRQSPRNVQIVLRKLVRLGELQIEERAGPGHVNVYRVLVGPGGENIAPPDLQGGENESTIEDPSNPSNIDINNIDINNIDINNIDSNIEIDINNNNIDNNIPHWFQVLTSIPKFDKSLDELRDWMMERAIDADLAERIAYGMADWWAHNPRASARKAPHLTFMNWCIREQKGDNNGRQSGKYLPTHDQTAPSGYEHYVNPR